MSGKRTSAQIDEEAVRWVARLDARSMSPAIAADLEAWASSDPRCKGALLRAHAAWATLNSEGVRSPAGASRPARPMMIRRRAVLMSAIFSVGIVGGGVMWLRRDRMQRYESAPMELRRLTLDDGSTAVMNEGAVMDVLISGRARNVALKRGEVWFDVAKDPGRPFVVTADRLVVQAVGTAFAVSIADNELESLVNEGSVTARLTGAAEPSQTFTAGKGAILSRQTLEFSSADLNVTNRLAWREGKIALEQERLGKAVEQFNRYNQVKIVVRGDELANRPVVGWFRLDDPVGFAEASAASLSAQVSRRGDTIELTAK